MRYVHFISLIILMAAVLGQHFLLKKEMKRAEIARVQRLDILYAIMVFGVLGTGFAQWLWVGKPADFYSSNPVFHIKLTLFLIVGAISAYPSVFLGKNKKGDAGELVKVPSLVTWSVRAELLILFFMPVLANLMARGIGIPLATD
ncbi:MAG: DUF2214 family protein [Verrucomicrobiota bacterium]